MSWSELYPRKIDLVVVYTRICRGENGVTEGKQKAVTGGES